MADNTPKEPSSTSAPEQQPTPPASANALVPAKTNTGLIIGLIIGAVILLIGIVIAIAVVLSVLTKDNKSSKGNTGSSSKQTPKTNEDKLRVASTKTASSLSDYSAVCQAGSVVNAATYSAPYKVAAFAKSNDKSSWSTVSLKYDAPYNVKNNEYTTVNAVVCLAEQQDAAVKVKTCDFKSGNEVKTIDYYVTVYDVAVFEAKSGKKIKDLGSVSAPAESCPVFVTYNKKDPKITAKPDSAALDALITQFAQ